MLYVDTYYTWGYVACTPLVVLDPNRLSLVPLLYLLLFWLLTLLASTRFRKTKKRTVTQDTLKRFCGSTGKQVNILLLYLQEMKREQHLKYIRII